MSEIGVVVVMEADLDLGLYLKLQHGLLLFEQLAREAAILRDHVRGGGRRHGTG